MRMNALEIAKNIEVQGTRLDALRPSLAETREVVIRGGVFGVALLVATFTASDATLSPDKFDAGFAAAMRVAAVLTLCGGLVGLCLPARQREAAAPISQRP